MSSLFLPFTEGKGAKVAVNDPQQLLGLGQAQRHMPHPKILHVVAALQILMHISLTCTTASSQSEVDTKQMAIMQQHL